MTDVVDDKNSRDLEHSRALKNKFYLTQIVLRVLILSNEVKQESKSRPHFLGESFFIRNPGLTFKSFDKRGGIFFHFSYNKVSQVVCLGLKKFKMVLVNLH